MRWRELTFAATSAIKLIESEPEPADLLKQRGRKVLWVGLTADPPFCWLPIGEIKAGLLTPVRLPQSGLRSVVSCSHEEAGQSGMTPWQAGFPRSTSRQN